MLLKVLLSQPVIIFGTIALSHRISRDVIVFGQSNDYYVIITVTFLG